MESNRAQLKELSKEEGSNWYESDILIDMKQRTLQTKNCSKDAFSIENANIHLNQASEKEEK